MCKTVSVLVLATMLSPGVAAAEQPRPAPTLLVGVLTEQFKEVCTGMQSAWSDAHWEAGFARLTLPADARPEPLKGKPVVVKGKVPPDARFAPPESGGAGCVMMQARSDWVIGKNDVRMVRGLPEGAVQVSAFEAASLEAFTGLEARTDKDEVVVTFVNTLGRKLDRVRISVHYEGCYGKPGVEVRNHAAGTLEAGSRVEARFPTVVLGDRSGGKRPPEAHLAWSVQVATTSPDVVMDLDVHASGLGLKLDCPKEPGSK